MGDDDGATLDPDKDWTEYWRILFKKVTLEDVKKFEEKFRGSTEEEEELKNAYIESEGQMGVIIDSVMCATIDDESRFHDLIMGWQEEEGRDRGGRRGTRSSPRAWPDRRERFFGQPY